MNDHLVHRFFTIRIPVSVVCGLAAFMLGVLLLVGCSKSTPTSPAIHPLPGTSATADSTLGISLKGIVVQSINDSLFFSFSCDSVLHVLGVMMDMDQNENTGRRIADDHGGFLPGGYDFYENYLPIHTGNRYRLGFAWSDAFGGNPHGAIGWLLLARTNIETHYGVAWGSH